MILLSFNCRGLASTRKKLALKFLLKSINCDVIMLQETLGAQESVMISWSLMLLDWSFVSLNVNGRSGYLAMGFRHNSIKLLTSWGSDLVLGVEDSPLIFIQTLPLLTSMAHVRKEFIFGKICFLNLC